MQDSLLNRSWAEVDLDNIAHNVKVLRKQLRREVEIMAVVKADAYGHGIKSTVPVLIENGVTRLAVSMLDEALELRKNNVKMPILVLSYTDPRRAREIAKGQITQTVYNMELAKALSIAGEELGIDVRIHIKVDTGMGRVGFVAGFDAIKSIEEISKMKNIVIEGIYTHFSSADEEDKTYTEMQFEKFMSICHELGRIGINIPIRHVCNSAAAIRFPHMHLDMIRPGILLYGMSPSKYCDAIDSGFKPAMSLKTNVILVKEVEQNQSISYGRTFTTKRKSIIATIPIGYADGYSRILSNKAEVLINGELLPIVGTICMDTCMVDVTDARDRQNSVANDLEKKERDVESIFANQVDKSIKPEFNIKVNDEVVLFGTQNDKSISVDDIASIMQTINYEVTCLIGKRIPRAYIQNGKIKEVQNYLLS